VDAATPVDAQNAPTGVWKSRKEREIPTASTSIIFFSDEEEERRTQPLRSTVHRIGSPPGTLSPALETQHEQFAERESNPNCGRDEGARRTSVALGFETANALLDVGVDGVIRLREIARVEQRLTHVLGVVVADGVGAPAVAKAVRIVALDVKPFSTWYCSTETALLRPSASRSTAFDPSDAA
jgi:hypothetical protein